MKTNITTIVLASAILSLCAAAAAQHIKAFDGKTGQPSAHGAGGGGGAGKVSVHDISISKNANALISFQGGVFVAAGDLNGDGLAMLQRTAIQNGNRQLDSFIVTFDRPVDPAATQGRGLFVISTAKTGPRSQNNLKQIGLGTHNTAEIRIGLIRPDGKGKMEEYKTMKLKGKAILQNSGRTLEFHLTGVEAAEPISTLGTWYLKNTNSPGEPILIGLLIPAIQKVRA